MRLGPSASITSPERTRMPCSKYVFGVGASVPPPATDGAALGAVNLDAASRGAGPVCAAAKHATIGNSAATTHRALINVGCTNSHVNVDLPMRCLPERSAPADFEPTPHAPTSRRGATPNSPLLGIDVAPHGQPQRAEISAEGTPSPSRRPRDLEQRLLPRQPPRQRAVLRRCKHPQLAKRHRAALGRLADESRELDAREPGGAELLDVEQL